MATKDAQGIRAYGFINTRGEVVIPLQYRHAGSFHGNYANVCEPDGRWRLIDRSGRATTRIFEGLGDSVEGRAPFVEGERFGFVDSTGRTIVPPVFTNVEDFSEGMAAVNNDDGWGLIDRDGRLVIEHRSANVGPFHDGMARADDGDQKRYIDSTGRWAVRWAQ